jgi:chemotaxis protein methyltransferase WspC
VSASSSDAPALLASVERILHARIGLDVTTVGSSLVHRAVKQRMAACGARSLPEYVARLGTDEPEMRELVDTVVIPETYFFREPEALDALAQRVTSSGAWPTADTPLRVLSAPCSTGEEPYSIALTLLAAGIPAAALAIDAIDVSHEAVRRARRAVYRNASFRGGAFDWRPYFKDEGNERALDPAVRRLVRVEQGNLFDPAFRAPRSCYDVVFCRNLLIYFDTEAQARVLATLTTLLAPQGILVVGAADSFAVRRAGYVPVAGAERAFLFQHRPNQEPDAVTPAAKPKAVGAAAGPTTRRRIVPGVAAGVTAAARRATAPRPAAPRERFPVPNGVIAAVTRLADEGRLAEAVHVGEAALDGAEAGAELLALLGTTYAALSEEARAESCYRRALYLDPSHPDALLHLALLLEGRGDSAGASRLRTRARRGAGASGSGTDRGGVE